MTERERAHGYQRTTSEDDIDDLGPGRATASSQLRAPSAPVVSGLIMRKAERDGNGVADGAAAAVDAAASSSGTPLPSAIQRKFESSLGADLSSVRVHTGGASEAAAHAVGAQAYTVGQDIHFGAGRYDPTSAAGEHLLAHEVAHTVQQRGGTATRQNKLEVSAPGDAAEYEADRAADAMVAGAASSVTGADSAVMRDELSERMSNAADWAHIESIQAFADPKNAPVVMGISTVGTQDEAKQQLAYINGARSVLETARDEKQASDADLLANEETKGQLEQFIDDLALQERALELFSPQFVRFGADFSRLIAQFGTLDSATAGALSVARRQTDATGLGVAIVENGAGASPREIGDDMARLVGSNGMVRAASEGLDGPEGTMHRLSKDMNEKEKACLKEEGLLLGATMAVQGAIAGVSARRLQSKIANVNSKASALKSGLKTASDLFKTGTDVDKAIDAREAMIGKAVGVMAKEGDVWKQLPGDIGRAALGDPMAWIKLAFDLAGLVVDLFSDASKSENTDEQKAAEHEKDDLERQALVKGLNGKDRELTEHANGVRDAHSAYARCVSEFEAAKKAYREKLQALGKAADRAVGAGHGYSVTAQLLGEGEAFLHQTKVTIDAAKIEKDRGDAASLRRSKVKQMTWNQAKRDRLLPAANGSIGFTIYKQPIRLLGTGEFGIEGPGNANAVMQKAIADLEEKRDHVDAMLGPLRTAMGRKDLKALD